MGWFVVYDLATGEARSIGSDAGGCAPDADLARRGLGKRLYPGIERPDQAPTGRSRTWGPAALDFVETVDLSRADKVMTDRPDLVAALTGGDPARLEILKILMRKA